MKSRRILATPSSILSAEGVSSAEPGLNITELLICIITPEESLLTPELLLTDKSEVMSSLTSSAISYLSLFSWDSLNSGLPLIASGLMKVGTFSRFCTFSLLGTFLSWKTRESSCFFCGLSDTTSHRSRKKAISAVTKSA